MSRRELEASIRALQPLPRTVAHLVELVESDTATIEQMESLINKDPILCGKILHIANSAYYGMARQISSIRHALLLLGAHTIKGIALSVAVVAALRTESRVDETEQQLWRHSLASASYAQGIVQAARWGQRVAEDAYIAGLLHDIGMVFLFTHFPNQYRSLLKQMECEPEQILEQELHTFGCEHTDVGAMIADHWQLPERIVQAIAEHHAPFLPDGEHQLLVAAVIQADLWEAEGISQPPAELGNKLSLSDDIATRIRQRVETHLESVSQVLLG
ncbi:MAG: HDOD domain-containing protein [Fimbriimonadales bacterium]|nr:HDOD domain-containing protein [Fimbriimonadales bacterium]